MDISGPRARLSTYQLAKMWLLFPGRHPSLISGIDICLVSRLARVAGGLVVGWAGGGVVTSRVGIPHHHLTAPGASHSLQSRVSLALASLQLLDFFLLLFLLLRLSVSNKSHAGVSFANL